MYRCHRFDHLMDLLSDHVQIATLNAQHNILKIFLKVERFKGDAISTEVRLSSGDILDLVWNNISVEPRNKIEKRWTRGDLNPRSLPCQGSDVPVIKSGKNPDFLIHEPNDVVIL